MTTDTKSEAAAASEPTVTRATRVYRKRRQFKHVPRPVYPIRAIWEAASEEERQKAHEHCALLLEYWLGVTTKQDVSKRLGVPPIRVWQLSQRAVGGMVCGLLRPPKQRAKMPSGTSEEPGSDPATLKKQIAKLERRIEWRDQLIAVLKTLPFNKGRELPPPPPEELEHEREKTGRSADVRKRVRTSSVPKGRRPVAPPNPPTTG
jgi:hypothetical protein